MVPWSSWDRNDSLFDLFQFLLRLVSEMNLDLGNQDDKSSGTSYIPCLSSSSF